MSCVVLAGPNHFRWRAYADLLRSRGHEVWSALTANSCVELLRAVRAHVLVLDTSLFGDEFASLSDFEKALPWDDHFRTMVIVIGNDRRAEECQFHHAIDEFVRQPMTPEELAQHVERFLADQHTSFLQSV